MSESKFTKLCCDALRAKGALVYACVATEYQSGWPDRYISHKYWHGWIEFKSITRRLETNQRIVIQQLQLRGDNALIIRESVDKRIGQLEDIDGKVIRVFWINDILELLIWAAI